MKKKLIILSSLLLILVVFTACKTQETPKEPFAANKVKQKINAYMFWGDGCPHCEKAKEFFNSIKEEYSSCFQLVEYEVWKSSEHKDIFAKASAHFGNDKQSVPLIIIGDKHFLGYADIYDADIIAEIENNCTSDDYKDTFAEVTKTETTSKKK